jgi:hypothetical protein
LQELLNLEYVFTAENEIKSYLRKLGKNFYVNSISTGIVLGWGDLIKVQFDT